MKVAVTGASGHVGGNLVRELLARGRRVRCLVHRDTRAIDGLDVEIVRGDVRDPGSLARAFRGIDIVYHLAALISIDGGQGGRVEAINVAGARNAARAARHCGARRLVHCSSIHAFDQSPLEEPLDETRARALGPEHPAYDRSKARGEAAVRDEIEAGLDAVILHPTAIIGPYDFKPSRMGQVLLNLHGRKLPALIDGGFDWVDVRDVVDGLMAAEVKGRRGESYLLSGHWHPVSGLAEMASSFTGVPAPRIVTPIWMAKLGAPFVTAFHRLFGGEPLYTRESVHALRSNRRIVREKAARELGYSPRPLVETLRDTYAWFAGAGMIRLKRPLADLPLAGLAGRTPAQSSETGGARSAEQEPTVR